MEDPEKKRGVQTPYFWYSRPVFISSTFRDMQAERDHLRDVVFLRLEKWLNSGLTDKLTVVFTKL